MSQRDNIHKIEGLPPVQFTKNILSMCSTSSVVRLGVSQSFHRRTIRAWGMMGRRGHLLMTRLRRQASASV